jgi:hypothetical protein
MNNRDTSHDALRESKEWSPTLRDLVETAIANSDRGMTVHECAASLSKTVPAVQPRFSELVRDGRITDSGLRRNNASGKSAIVWVISQ